MKNLNNSNSRSASYNSDRSINKLYKYSNNDLNTFEKIEKKLSNMKLSLNDSRASVMSEEVDFIFSNNNKHFAENSYNKFKSISNKESPNIEERKGCNYENLLNNNNNNNNKQQKQQNINKLDINNNNALNRYDNSSYYLNNNVDNAIYMNENNKEMNSNKKYKSDNYFLTNAKNKLVEYNNNNNLNKNNNIYNINNDNNINRYNNNNILNNMNTLYQPYSFVPRNLINNNNVYNNYPIFNSMPNNNMNTDYPHNAHLIRSVPSYYLVNNVPQYNIEPAYIYNPNVIHSNKLIPIIPQNSNFNNQSKFQQCINNSQSTLPNTINFNKYNIIDSNINYNKANNYINSSNNVKPVNKLSNVIINKKLTQQNIYSNNVEPKTYNNIFSNKNNILSDIAYKNTDNTHIKDKKENTENNSINKIDQINEHSKLSTNKVSQCSFINMIDNNKIDSIYAYLSNNKKCKKAIESLPQLNSNQIDTLFNKVILPNFKYIITSNTSNYFCQMFFKYLNKDQRLIIWNYLFSKINNNSNNKKFNDFNSVNNSEIIAFDKYIEYYSCADYSTHCIQSLTEASNTYEEQTMIVSNIEPYILNLCRNNRGTHIIQKLLLELKGLPKEDFNNKIIMKMYMISKEVYGISVLKKLVIYNKQSNLKFKNYLIDKITKDFIEICCDSYGNFFILCLFEEWGIQSCKTLIELINNNSYLLLTNRFATRIIYKVIELINNKVRHIVLFII